MFTVSNKKMGLDSAVLRPMDQGHKYKGGGEGGGAPKLTEKEMERMLKEGAIDIFKDGGNANSTNFEDLDLDTILARNATTLVDDAGPAAPSAFATATFEASGGERASRCGRALDLRLDVATKKISCTPTQCLRTPASSPSSTSTAR